MTTEAEVVFELKVITSPILCSKILNLNGVANFLRNF